MDVGVKGFGTFVFGQMRTRVPGTKRYTGNKNGGRASLEALGTNWKTFQKKINYKKRSLHVEQFGDFSVIFVMRKRKNRQFLYAHSDPPQNHTDFRAWGFL